MTANEKSLSLLKKKFKKCKSHRYIKVIHRYTVFILGISLLDVVINISDTFSEQESLCNC